MTDKTDLELELKLKDNLKFVNFWKNALQNKEEYLKMKKNLEMKDDELIN